MQAQKISVEPTTLGKLIQEIGQGKIRIPRFQREFVWGHKMTSALFDSMSREYPIGSFFLWLAPAKYNDLIRVVDDLGQATLSKDSDHRLILDGQQRLTSLFAVVNGLTLEGANYRNLSLDLDSEQENRDENPFALRKFIDNQRYVSVSDLLSDGYLKIYNQLKSENRKDRFLTVRECLRTYPFSSVTVEVDDIEPAIDIFERINQEGQKLSRFDLVAAHVYDREFDLRVRVEEDFFAKLRNKSFGVLPLSIVPQALVINLEKSVSFRSQIGLKPSDVKKIWKDTAEALLKAIDWLHDNQGVENNKFLPYDQIVPILAHYFYYCRAKGHKSSHSEHEQLKRWFWLVVFGERYGDSAQSRMIEDANWVRELVNDGAEVRLRFTVDESVLIDTYMTQRSAVKNGVLCLLNLLKPKHFVTGERVSLGDDHFSSLTKAERHHVFPVSYLLHSGKSGRDVHRLPNFCFIPSDLNKEIGNKEPSRYLENYKTNHKSDETFFGIMETHLIPHNSDSPVWENKLR